MRRTRRCANEIKETPTLAFVFTALFPIGTYGACVARFQIETLFPAGSCKSPKVRKSAKRASASAGPVQCGATGNQSGFVPFRRTHAPV